LFAPQVLVLLSFSSLAFFHLSFFLSHLFNEKEGDIKLTDNFK
jgi:hypothetical protein